LENYFRPIL